MKRLFIISLLFVVLGMTANAQVQYKTFADDAINADTTTYVSNVVVTKFSTITLGFAFTKVDGTDSLSAAKIQGSMDNTNYVDLVDATANLTNTSTDGTTVLYVTSPVFLYYRGLLSCATGDTVAVTNAIFTIKED